MELKNWSLGIIKLLLKCTHINANTFLTKPSNHYLSMILSYGSQGFLNCESINRVCIGRHAERWFLNFVLNSIPTVVVTIHKASETCQGSSQSWIMPIISKEIILNFLHHLLDLLTFFQTFEPGHIFQMCKNAFR